MTIKYPYHLIFADFEIADENCVEMLKKIKSLQPDLSIIVLSAITPTKIESCLHDLDIHNIIEKPFNLEHIVSIAQEALNLSNKKHIRT